MSEQLLISEAERAFTLFFRAATLHRRALTPETRQRLRAEIKAHASHLATLAASVRDPGVQLAAHDAALTVSLIDVPIAEARAKFEATGTRFYFGVAA